LGLTDLHLPCNKRTRLRDNKERKMMPVIRVTQPTWERLQGYARPFVEKPEDVIVMALNALDEKVGRNTEKLVASAPVDEDEIEGKKLPQKALRLPLLQAVLELGGSARVWELRGEMEKKVAPLLGPADYRAVSSGEPRWWNAICWERADLVRDGVFANDGERGVWKLTEEGKKMAKSAVFEQILIDEWVVERSDIYERGIGSVRAVDTAQPIRLDKVVAWLSVSEEELLDLLKSGNLPRPGQDGHGRVIWRKDEVGRLAAQREFLK
jgi:predicted DNA-binding transcriptional regulator AlpA